MNKGDILEIVKSLRSDWNARTQKISEWYELRELADDPEWQLKYEHVTSNEPRTFFNLALHFLSSSPPSHRLPLTVQSLEEQDRMNGFDVLSFRRIMGD